MSVMLWPCIFCVALLMYLFVLFVACLTVCCRIILDIFFVLMVNSDHE